MTQNDLPCTKIEEESLEMRTHNRCLRIASLAKVASLWRIFQDCTTLPMCHRACAVNTFLPLWFRLRGERILVLHGALLVSLSPAQKQCFSKGVILQKAQNSGFAQTNGQLGKFQEHC